MLLAELNDLFWVMNVKWFDNNVVYSYKAVILLLFKKTIFDFKLF